MMTRRTGILAALCAPMATVAPAVAEPLTSSDITSIHFPQKWRFSLSLDGMDGLDIIHAGKTLHISPEEIWAALSQQPLK